LKQWHTTSHIATMRVAPQRIGARGLDSTLRHWQRAYSLRPISSSPRNQKNECND
jgi:hypothetical protein